MKYTWCEKLNLGFLCLHQCRLTWGMMFSTWLFILSSICYQICEHGILNMNEPILLQIGTSGPDSRRQGHETMSFGVRSKVTVTGGWWSGAIILHPVGSSRFSNLFIVGFVVNFIGAVWSEWSARILSWDHFALIDLAHLSHDLPFLLYGN